MFGETARISIMVDGDQRAMGVEKDVPVEKGASLEEVCLNFGIN